MNLYVLFESQFIDMLINAGTALIYLTGLVGFVAWLERNKIKQGKTSITEKL